MEGAGERGKKGDSDFVKGESIHLCHGTSFALCLQEWEGDASPEGFWHHGSSVSRSKSDWKESKAKTGPIK